MPDTVSLKTREAIAQNVKGQEVQVLSKSFSCAEVWEVLAPKCVRFECSPFAFAAAVHLRSVLSSVSCTTLNSCFGYAETATTQKLGITAKKHASTSQRMRKRRVTAKRDLEHDKYLKKFFVLDALALAMLLGTCSVWARSKTGEGCNPTTTLPKPFSLARTAVNSEHRDASRRTSRNTPVQCANDKSLTSEN